MIHTRREPRGSFRHKTYFCFAHWTYIVAELQHDGLSPSLIFYSDSFVIFLTGYCKFQGLLLAELSYASAQSVSFEGFERNKSKHSMRLVISQFHKTFKHFFLQVIKHFSSTYFSKLEILEINVQVCIN